MCLNAATVVDLGGEYLTNAIPTSTPANTTTAPFSGNFDPNGPGTDTAVAITLGSVWTPLSASNVAIPAGQSGANLKMGAIITNNDSTTAPGQEGSAFTYSRITQYALPATFQFSGTNPGTRTDLTADMSLASMFYYEKADFLNGGAGATSITFGAGDEIGATFALHRGDGKGRMLLRNAGSWYISADSVDDQWAGAAISLTVDGTTGLFYSFDPSGNNFIFDESAAGPTIAASTFTDIDAVGIHMQQLNYDGTAVAFPYQFFYGITGDLTAIPEPSTFSILTGALALGVVFTRRRVR